MGKMTLESRSSEGKEAGNWSNRPAISSDGRYVVFESQANNLVPGDTNDSTDVFVRDRLTGTTRRVSVLSSGEEGNSSSFVGSRSISDDGRYVAFVSYARNHPGDKTFSEDVRVHDLLTGETEMVSVSSSGQQGRHFPTYNAGFPPPAVAISAEGRHVAFMSWDVGLVTGDTNSCPWYSYDRVHRSFLAPCPDIFVRDRVAGTTARVSISSSGVQANDGSSAPSISGNGRFVSFQSSASNLVAGDTNGIPDVFVHDRLTGKTERVSISSPGDQALGGTRRHPPVERGGFFGMRYWPFVEEPLEPVGSHRPSISDDGRYVAFSSSAVNLVPRDTNLHEDVFVHDRLTRVTRRVSVSSWGDQALAGDSYLPAISGDGRYVSFISAASNLVPADTNGKDDVFVHDGLTGVTIRVSVPPSGGEANSYSDYSSLSKDGRFIAFRSAANNLAPGAVRRLGIYVYEFPSMR